MQKAGIILVLVVAALGLAPAWAQQGYFPVTGGVELCGLAANDQPALIAQLQAAPDIAEHPSGTPRFTLYRAADGLTDWLVTTTADSAHPAVSCRQLSLAESGAVQMQRGMHCDAEKADCDRLWGELRRMDATLRTQLAAR